MEKTEAIHYLPSSYKFKPFEFVLERTLVKKKTVYIYYVLKKKEQGQAMHRNLKLPLLKPVFSVLSLQTLRSHTHIALLLQMGGWQCSFSTHLHELL
jgi:hypothetical protein